MNLGRKAVERSNRMFEKVHINSKPLSLSPSEQSSHTASLTSPRRHIFLPPQPDHVVTDKTLTSKQQQLEEDLSLKCGSVKYALAVIF